ncbi:MAG: TMEM165/GDT1 family protein [Pseudomonadota bacterium]
MDALREALNLWRHELVVLLTSDFGHWFKETLFSGDLNEWITTASTGFALIAAAEIGDKSQLVCMTLAARHRGWPILFGALAAFALLNLGAVLFGAVVGTLVPRNIVAIAVAVMFAGFGIHAILAKEDDGSEEIREKSSHGIFLTTFLLIFVAEFGDKTQIAVAGLSSAAIPASVWLGATLALGTTSALGIWAGRTILQRFPVVLLHRIGGILFLALAAFAAYEAFVLTKISVYNMASGGAHSRPVATSGNWRR